MTLSATEAQDALRDVDRVAALAQRSGAYRQTAPYLQLWGAVWAIGYVAPLLFPDISEGLIWGVLDTAGAAGSLILANRARRNENPAERGKKLVACIGAMVLFVLFLIATFTVLPPATIAQVRVYPGLVLGLAYGLVGVFWLPRFLIMATLVPIAGLLAYFLHPESLPWVMALAGGGSISVCGLWMRSA